MTGIRPTHFWMAVLVFAMCCGSSLGATLIVGVPGTPCPNAQYSTISNAVNAASPGDLIDICPALYVEQLVITKPLTLRGIPVNGVNRVLVQPTTMSTSNGMPSVAVITVVNTTVDIENLAIDASNNTASGCTPSLSTVHYFNSSGQIENSAISGALLQNVSSCGSFFSNGYGILIDTDGTQTGPFRVSVAHNSIHDFTKDGIHAIGAGVTVDIDGNSITGVGPTSGNLQFGVFLISGAGGQVTGNHITEGTCGTLSIADCVNLRSEGVVLRVAADGTVVDGNSISNAQAGIFINGGNKIRISSNVISNIDVFEPIHIQGSFTNSLVQGNTIFNTTPIANEVCGIAEIPGTIIGQNRFVNNTVNDAYCGVGYLTADTNNVVAGSYFNTLYATLNLDLFPITLPPPVEP